MDRRRLAGAAVAGAVGAAAYLAGGGVVRSRPVKGGALGLLAVAALAGIQATAKTRALDQRFNKFLATGGTIGGDVHCTGRVTADQGMTCNANLNMSDNNITNVAQIPGGFTIDNGSLWMNGNKIFMEDGTLCLRNGHVETAGGSTWPSGKTPNCQ